MPLLGQLHESLMAGDQLAPIAERNEVGFAHQADFEPELAGLDHRRKDAAGIGLGPVSGSCGTSVRCAPCDRTQVLGQCAGNFAFELLQRSRERHHVGLHALGGTSGCCVGF